MKFHLHLECFCNVYIISHPCLPVLIHVLNKSNVLLRHSRLSHLNHSFSLCVQYLVLFLGVTRKCLLLSSTFTTRSHDSSVLLLTTSPLFLRHLLTVQHSPVRNSAAIFPKLYLLQCLFYFILSHLCYFLFHRIIFFHHGVLFFHRLMCSHKERKKITALHFP